MLSSQFDLEVLCLKSRGSSDCWAQEISLESRILTDLTFRLVRRGG